MVLKQILRFLIYGKRVRNIDFNGEYNQLQKIDVIGLLEGFYLLRMVDLDDDILKIKKRACRILFLKDLYVLFLVRLEYNIRSNTKT